MSSKARRRGAPGGLSRGRWAGWVCCAGASRWNRRGMPRGSRAGPRRRTSLPIKVRKFGGDVDSVSGRVAIANLVVGCRVPPPGLACPLELGRGGAGARGRKRRSARTSPPRGGRPRPPRPARPARASQRECHRDHHFRASRRTSRAAPSGPVRIRPSSFCAPAPGPYPPPAPGPSPLLSEPCLPAARPPPVSLAKQHDFVAAGSHRFCPARRPRQPPGRVAAPLPRSQGPTHTPGMPAAGHPATTTTRMPPSTRRFSRRSCPGPPGPPTSPPRWPWTRGGRICAPGPRSTTFPPGRTAATTGCSGASTGAG